MDKAFVDTTILVDVLLKTGEQHESALASLQAFQGTEAPAYAIREFKSGALSYFRYAHNAVLQYGLAGALEKLSALVRTPQRNRPATALTALAQSLDELDLPSEFASTYGEAAGESVRQDRLVVSLKVAIFRAWRQRRTVTDRITNELSCFDEDPPQVEPEGHVSFREQCCDLPCGLQEILSSYQAELMVLSETIDALPDSSERGRNWKAIKKLRKQRQLTTSDCRGLGDVVFALLAPDDAYVLTTNVKDHRPLADALGKQVCSPSEVLSRGTD